METIKELDYLKKLAELKNSGVLTMDEFLAEKNKLLAKTASSSSAPENTNIQKKVAPDDKNISSTNTKKKRGFWGVVKGILFWAFIAFVGLFGFALYLDKSGYNPKPKVKVTAPIVESKKELKVEPTEEKTSTPPMSEVSTQPAQ